MTYNYRFPTRTIFSINSEFGRKGISVGPYVISCQMFVKSEFPLDSALVCDSDQKKLGWHFFRKL